MEYRLSIDIGASSGRHVLGHIENGRVVMQEVYRFVNHTDLRDGHAVWDTERLFSEILAGMRACSALGNDKIPRSVAIDTWGVDYVLTDADGERVSDVYAYRDAAETLRDAVESRISFNELYALTGIQYQPFNSLYRINQTPAATLNRAEHFLMMPEYFNFLLTGEIKNEYTNATTTGLVNARTRDWDEKILNALSLRPDMFGKLHFPGETVGRLTKDVCAKVGYDTTIMLAPSHDTASAFHYAKRFCTGDDSAILSSGTWSLLGTINSAPITSDAARCANFTNEGGCNGTYRFLKNIMGLWILQCIRREMGEDVSFRDLSRLARENSSFDVYQDVNIESFLAPKSMINAVNEACKKQGRTPKCIGETLQCVYISLAKCYANAINELQSITGKRFDSIVVVGGGARDTYLNSLTEKATGIPVIAAETEATAAGNLAVQFGL